MKELKKFKQVNVVLAEFVPPPRSLRENYTLERMYELMGKLGNPQNSYKVVHVAGTSGKTSTSYYIAAMLKEAGAKVGLTVSPHIDEVNERVQIDLTPLAEKQFCLEINEFLNLINRTGIKPTYFELLVAFAYWEFARQKVDYVVVEVGVGGLLDGTNVIARADKVCVITDIGLDHTSVLGKTLQEIAVQKAGIIQEGNVTFAYKQTPEINEVLQRTAEQKKAKLHEISPAPDLKYSLSKIQQRNWYLAWKVYEYIAQRDGLPDLDSQKQLASAKTYIPARMEIMEVAGKTLILDGAHNAQKMEALVSSLQQIFPSQKVAVLLSLIQSQDYRVKGVLEQLTKLANHVIVTEFASQQDLVKTSVPPQKILQTFSDLGYSSVEIVKKPEAALQSLLKRQEPILLVTGSFYLMSQIRQILVQDGISFRPK